MPSLALRMQLARAVALLALALGVVPAAHAETTACLGVGPLPATISAPGHYCLGADVDVPGDDTYAITITASDVVLDCNDRRLRSTSTSSSTIGVYVFNQAWRVDVRNCRVEGFGTGIRAEYTIDDQPRVLRIQGNRIARSHGSGIAAFGSGILIEGNHIVESLGSESRNPVGIQMSGHSGGIATGNVVRNNTVTNFKPDFPGPSNLTIGIQFAYQQGIVVEGNTVAGLYARTGTGVYGMTGAGTEAMMRGNTVLSSPPLAAPFDGSNYTGFFLQGTAEEQATNVCVDNRVGHFNSNLAGCGTQAANTTF
jgi:hypothetical protein